MRHFAAPVTHDASWTWSRHHCEEECRYRGKQHVHRCTVCKKLAHHERKCRLRSNEQPQTPVPKNDNNKDHKNKTKEAKPQKAKPIPQVPKSVMHNASTDYVEANADCFYPLNEDPDSPIPSIRD